jgi:hypothetical protein
MQKQPELTRRKQSRQHEELIQDVENRQRNTVWPDTLRNGRGVDEFLWKGAPDAPLVQRIGAWVFGSFFLLGGVVFIDIAYEKRESIDLIMGIAFMALGTRVCRNGFRRSSSDHHG